MRLAKSHCFRFFLHFSGAAITVALFLSFPIFRLLIERLNFFLPFACEISQISCMHFRCCCSKKNELTNYEAHIMRCSCSVHLRENFVHRQRIVSITNQMNLFEISHSIRNKIGIEMAQKREKKGLFRYDFTVKL